MGGIDIDVDVVNSVCRNLAEYIKTLQCQVNDLKSVESDVQQFWKSKYTSEYIACVEDTQSELEKTVDLLEDVKRNLNKIAYNVEETERTLQNTFLGSGGGIR